MLVSKINIHAKYHWKLHPIIIHVLCFWKHVMFVCCYMPLYSVYKGVYDSFVHGQISEWSVSDIGISNRLCADIVFKKVFSLQICAVYCSGPVVFMTWQHGERFWAALAWLSPTMAAIPVAWRPEPSTTHPAAASASRGPKHGE